jgi:hypothetical protein
VQKIDAINWMEQWASRHEVAVRPWRKCRPGEERIGYPVEIMDGSWLPVEALDELLGMGNQLTFSEFGPPPASGESGSSAPADGGSSGEPPIDNMGGRVTFPLFKGLDVGQSLFAAVDQFTLVGKGAESREAMRCVMQSYLGEGQAGLFGLSYYRESWRFEAGASINWSEGREDWCCIVTGQTLQLVGEEKHLQFLVDLDAHAHHCTRVDPRIDDYSRQLIVLDEVERAMDAGNFSGPRKCEVIRSGKLSKGKVLRQGASLVFGSRDGARVLFYDKGLQSKGRIPSNRLEVAYYKEKATAAWVKLMNGAHCGLNEFTQAVGELVCGAIDFRQRGSHKELERMERLAWWSAIVDRLGSVRVRVEKVVSSLNGAMVSMVKQYGKKLARAAVVSEAKGYELVLDLIGAIDRLREGQELEDRDLSPLEAAFNPVRVFGLRGAT